MNRKLPDMKVEMDNQSASPLVSAVTKTLTERIHAGRYRDARGFPSERELIKEFAVSRAIVRKALDTLVAQDLLIRAPRCRTVVRRSGDPHLPAAKTRRHSLAIWAWPNPTDVTAAAILQGVSQALDHEAYRIVIGSLVWGSWEMVRQTEESFLGQIREDQDIAGLLLCYLGEADNLPALRKVREAGIPMVFMDRRPPAGFDGDFVGIENKTSAAQAIEHLVSQGHRRIAHVTSEDRCSTVRERMEGYRRGLEKAGIAFDPQLVVLPTDLSLTDVNQAYDALLTHLLSLPVPPTAVFAVNDVTAESILSALRRQGLRVPDDMAVVGFDGLERWKTSNPFLTTIEQPFEQIGQCAARLLLQRIEHRSTLTYQHILLQAPLRVYGSTLGKGAEHQEKAASMTKGAPH